jgi:integrase
LTQWPIGQICKAIPAKPPDFAYAAAVRQSPLPSRSAPCASCAAYGYALANAGHDTRRIQDWLGHKSIAHTTRYTQLSAAPFKDLWG